MNHKQLFATALQAPTQKEKIQRLLNACRVIAEKNIAEFGAQNPTFLAISPKNVIVLTTPFQDDQDKVEFYQCCRLVATANESEFSILVCETWGAPDDGRQLLPSQSPDRFEAIVVLLETNSERYGVSCEIIRNKRGQFKKLGAPTLQDSKFTGRATGFLPPPELAKQAAAEARFTLMALGLNPDGSPLQPDRN